MSEFGRVNSRPRWPQIPATSRGDVAMAGEILFWRYLSRREKGESMSSKKSAVLLGAAIAGLLSGTRISLAAPVLSNGDFTYSGNGSFTDLSVGSTSLSGWSIGDGANDGTGDPVPAGAGTPGVDVITGYFPSPPGGGNSVDLDGDAPGSISTTFNVSGSTLYTLVFYAAANTDGPPIQKMLQVALDPSAAFSDHPLPVQYNISSAAQKDGWQQESVVFVTAAAATSETLTFTSLDPASDSFPNDAYGPVIGNVSVTIGIGASIGTSSVPLPKSAGVGFGMLAGIGTLISLRKRFARKLEIA
jgi:hypothetical protein